MKDEVYPRKGGNPCKGCPDRYPACSDHCVKPEKLAWNREQETIRENRRKYNVARDYISDNIEKNRRKR